MGWVYRYADEYQKVHHCQTPKDEHGRPERPCREFDLWRCDECGQLWVARSGDWDLEWRHAGWLDGRRARKIEAGGMSDG